MIFYYMKLKLSTAHKISYCSNSDLVLTKIRLKLAKPIKFKK